MSESWHTENVDTPAGIYTVDIYPDDEPGFHPLEDDCEVFAVLVEFSGYGGHWDESTDTLDSAGRAGEVVRELLADYAPAASAAQLAGVQRCYL